MPPPSGTTQGEGPKTWQVVLVLFFVAALIGGTTEGRAVAKSAGKQLAAQAKQSAETAGKPGKDGKGGGLNLASLFGGIRLPRPAAPAQPAPRPSGPAPSVPVSASARGLLKSPRVELTPNARADLRSGRVSGCLVRVLAGLAKRHSFAISVLKTGHSKYVAGTRSVSNHYVWEGADIWKVDGRKVRAGNKAAKRAAIWLLQLRGGCRPSEVGSPWDLDPVNRASFTNYGHRDHLHVGI